MVLLIITTYGQWVVMGAILIVVVLIDSNTKRDVVEAKHKAQPIQAEAR
jgi:ribose/xylose/arabinose/galactoside ABC-type transport system permease subunit